MIDMIRDNLTTDIACVYGTGFGAIYVMPRDLIKSDSNSFASKFASMEKSATKASEKLIEQFTELE